MKTIALSLFTALLIVFLVIALPVNGEEAVYEDVVRLHVLPASDSAEDQTLKVLVRDVVLTEYGETLSAFKTKEEAEAYLEKSLPNIQKTVEGFLKEQGKNQTVSVTLTEENFETRKYGEITLPAGSYTSLSIRLDEGEGQNWWCILYPALCTRAALGETVPIDEALTDAEYHLVTDSGYVLRFRTLEILKSIFG